MRTNKKILAIVALIALVAVLGVCLVACNADSYAKKLEKKGYDVKTVEAGKDDDGYAIEWGVVGTKKGDSLLAPIVSVSVTKYKSTDDAKEVESFSKDLLGGDCVYRTGKIVIVGTTAQSVKDAK